jgi:hypothetical protein
MTRLSEDEVMNDYAHLRLHDATLRGLRSPRHTRPSAGRHGGAARWFRALLTGDRDYVAADRTSASGHPTPAACA